MEEANRMTVMENAIASASASLLRSAAQAIHAHASATMPKKLSSARPIIKACAHMPAAIRKSHNFCRVVITRPLLVRPVANGGASRNCCLLFNLSWQAPFTGANRING